MEVASVVIGMVFSIVILISFLGGYMLRSKTESKPPIQMYQPIQEAPLKPNKKVDMSTPFVSQKAEAAAEEAYAKRMADFKDSGMFIPQMPQKSAKKKVNVNA